MENTNQTSKKRLNIKLIAIIVAILVVLFFILFSRDAKSTVKKYIESLEQADAKQVMSVMNYEGMIAFSSSSSDLKDFDSKYTETLKNMSKEKKSKYSEAKEKITENLQKSLDQSKEQKINYTIENIRTEKVEECKKLTKVICDLKISIDGNESLVTDVKFYTIKKGLKHYIVSADL